MAQFTRSVTAARQRVEAVVARTLARVPPSVIETLLARHALVAGEHRLDAQVQWADLMRRVARHAPLEHGSVARARREYRRMSLLERRAPAVASVQEHSIVAPHGSIPARLYRSDTRAAQPLLLYLHGGGGVIGDLETHDIVCRTFASRSEVAVLAVDYRLAPEHSYMDAAEDALAAYRWVHDNAAGLGVRLDRIAVGGDSRGGKLATVVCQLAQLQGDPQPRMQMLIYPSTDVVTDYPSRAQFANAPWLGAGIVSWFERHAFPAHLDRSDPRVSPLLAADLGGLAPALVVVAGFDPLRDEGIAYVQRLRAAGVPVALSDEPTLPHGFLQLTGVSRAAARATDDIADELRRALV